MLNGLFAFNLQELQDEIAKQRATLERMDQVGRELVSATNENPFVVAEVQSKLSKVRARLDNLDNRAECRREVLQSVLLQLQVFEVTHENFKTDIAELETELENMRPVSAIFVVVDEQKGEAQSFANSLTKKEPVYEKLVEEGERMLEKMLPGDERDEHQANLEDTKARWEALKDNSEKLRNKIEEVHEIAGQYDKKSDKFNDWLEETEKKLGKIRTKSYTQDKANDTVEEVSAVLEDIFCHEPHFEDLKESANNDIETSEADGDVVMAEFLETKHRWDALNITALKKKDEAEQVKEALDKYHSALQPVQEAFTQAETLLSESEPLGTNVDKIREELEQVKDLRSTLDDRKPDIKEMSQSGNILLSGEGQSPLSTEIKDKLDSTNQKAKDTPEKLLEREKALEKALKDASDFNTVLEDIEKWLPAEQEVVESLEPVSTEPEKIKEQIKDTDKIQEEVKRYLVRLQHLEEVGQRLIEDNVSDPRAVDDIQNKIDKVRTPLEKLCGKLEQRNARLQNAAIQSQEFQDSCNDFVGRLGNIEDQLVDDAPISPEYQQTKKQKDQNEDVQDVIEQEEPIFENLMKAGDGILELSEPGDERKAVEKKLADLKYRWESIKDKAKKRDEQIESVLPDAREYHKGRTILEPWLTEAEKKIAGIKISSSDPEDIKKQGNALSALKDDVAKHKPDHQSLNNAADSLIDKCHDNSYVIDAQIKDINRRWNALRKEIEEKDALLLNAESASEKLQDNVSIVEAAINKAEVALEACEPIIEPEIARRDLANVEAALLSLEHCEPKKKEADQMAHNLLDSMDETSTSAIVLKKKMDDLDEKYNTTLNATKDKKGHLKKLVILIVEFVEIYEEITIWIEETKPVVDSAKEISSVPVIVKSQLTEVELLQDSVADKKRDLEKAEKVGQQLVETCDKNPHVINEVNLKLAKIKAPLENIAVKLDDRQTKLQMVVLQTQAFQDTLDDFEDKLSKIEDDLARMLPVSPVYERLRDQTHNHAEVADDVKQLEPVYSKLSSCGYDVLESLEPGEEKELLKDKLNEIDQRWNNVKEKVDDRKANIDEVTPDAKNYHEHSHSLIPCLEDAESYLTSCGPIPCDEKALAREEKLLQELLDTVEDKKPVVERLNEAAKSLAELCDNPEVTQAEIKDTNKRWTAVLDGLQKRKDQLDDVKTSLADLKNVIEPVEVTLEEAQPILEAPTSYGADVKKSQDELYQIEVSYCVLHFHAIAHLKLLYFEVEV